MHLVIRLKLNLRVLQSNGKTLGIWNPFQFASELSPRQLIDHSQCVHGGHQTVGENVVVKALKVFKRANLGQLWLIAPTELVDHGQGIQGCHFAIAVDIPWTSYVLPRRLADQHKLILAKLHHLRELIGMHPWLDKYRT